MEPYNDVMCRADKGKMFVLTQKGKDEVASYRNNEAEKPIEYGYADETHAYNKDIINGYVKEIDDPDFVIMPGYRAVYNNGHGVFDVGNPCVFPFKEQAEAAVREFDNRPWKRYEDSKAYVIEATYEGKRPKECREYDGKKVHNIDSWTYDYPAGTLAEDEVVNDALNCLPPACMRSDCSQLGEPRGTRIDNKGVTRNTYATFKRISEGIWEYCGDCFRGENIQRGKEPAYL